MAHKTNEGFYYNLSRKELQTLCKRYGLPANRSHSDLAKSLVAYLEVGFGGPMYNLWENFHAQCNGSGLSRNEFPRKYSSENCLGLARDRSMEDVPEVECREINVGACPAQTAAGCPVETPAKGPSSSFEFHVRSEEGINLYVDLNSSLSEWTKRFKNEVCVCENVHSNRTVRLHHDLGFFGKGDEDKRISFLQNIDAGENDDGHVSTKIDHVGLEQPAKVDGTFATSAVRPFNIDVEVSEHLMKDQTLISSELDSAAQRQTISGAPSYAQDCCTLMLDSNVFNNFQKSICDSAANLISEDQLSPAIMNHQNSKLDNCGNPRLQDGYTPLNLSVVYPGYSASASIELQSSEVVSCHKDATCSPCGNGGLVALFDSEDNAETEKGGLVSSCELDTGVLVKYVPKYAEAWEMSNITNAMESPECSQLTSSVEKSCFSYDNLEYNEELSKKRKHIEAEHQSGYGNPDAKNLTSMKHVTRKVLPRRSVRLITQ